MITFEDYCEELLDMHICLMTEQEIKEAYQGYITKPTKVEKHKWAHLKVGALRAKAENLIDCQRIAIERNADKDISLTIALVKYADELFSKKATKAQLLDLITKNSEASRILNAQINGE